VPKSKSKIMIRRVRGSIVTLSLTISFDEKAEFAPEVYRHIAEILRSGLGPRARKEFLAKLARAKKAAFPELPDKGGSE